MTQFLRSPWLLAPALLLASVTASAQGFPGCNGAANEQLMEWPAGNPTWQLCYLRPSQSVGPRGSGLELRNVYYQGRKVLKRAHAPMLFAEYRNGAGGNCYRDWKDENSQIFANTAVQNMLGTSDYVRTSCDRSDQPLVSYGNCPFGLSQGGATCFTGVAIQDGGDRVTLTTQYVAGWYLYSTRFILHADGRIEPLMGFGNSNGTYNNVTHWHHNYWRLDFDIDGADADVLSINGAAQSGEFASVRNRNSTYEVYDSNNRLGYRMTPGNGEESPPRLELSFDANESTRGFHTVDVMGTEFINNEYSDRANNNLGDCQVVVSNLVTPTTTLAGKDVVLYYRASVRDSAGDYPPSAPVPANPMVCKSVGPQIVPFGPWQDLIFAHGTEG